MSTLTDTNYTLSNTCSCTYCLTCGVVWEDLAECQDCGNPTRAEDYCDGACYEYKLEWVENDLEEYCKANACEYIRLDGSRMGWQARSGYKVIKATRKDLLDSLTFSGDWSLNFIRSGESFTITRYSHDEPMGASFTITPDKGEDIEE